jgi:hypothetical protein
MTPSGAFSRVRSAALLFAALLHLAGIIGEPVLHRWVRVESHAPGWSAPRPDQGPAPHGDDRVCVICQAAHARALPQSGAVPLAADVSRAPAPSSALSLPALPDHAPVQARAPPVSIA